MYLVGSVCFISGVQSPGVRCCLFISGILTCLLVFMNVILVWGIYTSVPFFENATNATGNFSNGGVIRNFNIKEAIMEKQTNLTFRNHAKIKASSIKVHSCSKSFRRNHLMTICNPGRTGNNLFQLATLIATAESTCYTAVRFTRRLKYLDNIFDLQNVEYRAFNRNSFKLLHEGGWSIYMENITSSILPEFNWTLTGYRQSYRYFQNHSKLIKSSFRFKEYIKRDVIHYLEHETWVYKGLSVCMHVRRRDSARHFSSLSYVNRVIAYYKKQLAPSNFSIVVTSDDLSWCKNNLQGVKIYFSPFQETGRDLFLLTQCNHNAMTFGSFGWFGAWLNETGMVVYDRTFAQNQVGHNPEDYFPKHWIGL